MKRWLPITLFALAILAFFISGRLESAHRTAVKQRYSAPVQLEPPSRVLRPPVLPARPEYPATQQYPTAPPPEAPSQTTSVMAIAITVIFGLSGLWMVMTNSPSIDDERRRWALGTLGIIIGYWLKG